MNYLLDTCVLSEYTRRKPESKVLLWVDSMDEERLFLSVLTIGEIKEGIESIPASNRKTELSIWLNEGLIKRFEDRIYLIDVEVMLAWGALYARLQGAGQPLPLVDSLIAATALVHQATLVTRNEEDFLRTGVQLVNPWR